MRNNNILKEILSQLAYFFQKKHWVLTIFSSLFYAAHETPRVWYPCIKAAVFNVWTYIRHKYDDSGFIVVKTFGWNMTKNIWPLQSIHHLSLYFIFSLESIIKYRVTIQKHEKYYLIPNSMKLNLLPHLRHWSPHVAIGDKVEQRCIKASKNRQLYNLRFFLQIMTVKMQYR